MTAQAAIAFAKYMMFASEARTPEDYRTLGELFFLISDELQDISFARAMQLMMNIFRNLVGEYFLLSEAEIEALMDAFMLKLPLELYKLLHIAA